MSKTAMQELIEYLEFRDRKFTYTYKKAIELLEKEKEQLEEARLKGYGEGYNEGIYDAENK